MPYPLTGNPVAVRGCTVLCRRYQLSTACVLFQMYLFVIMMTYSVLGVYLWKEVYANQDDEDCDGAFNDPFASWLSLMGACAIAQLAACNITLGQGQRVTVHEDAARRKAEGSMR
jgi:hypothetical protein